MECLDAGSPLVRLELSDPHLRHGRVAARDIDLRAGFDQRARGVGVSTKRRDEERGGLVLRGARDPTIRTIVTVTPHVSTRAYSLSLHAQSYLWIAQVGVGLGRQQHRHRLVGALEGRCEEGGAALPVRARVRL